MKQSEFNIELLKNKEMICRTSSFCYQSDLGVHGRFFGGTQMAELDTACAVFAAEVIDTPWIVTKKMNIEFVAPITVNQVYKIYIGIENIGNTSIRLNAEIRLYSIETEKEVVCVKCDAVFVRINEQGESIKISDNVRKKFGYDAIG